MRTPIDTQRPPIAPAPRANASLRPRRARLGSPGAIAALMVLPPAVLGVFFIAEPEAGRAARDGFDSGLMAAGMLLVLLAHAWTLMALLRGRRDAEQR